MKTQNGNNLYQGTTEDGKTAYFTIPDNPTDEEQAEMDAAELAKELGVHPSRITANGGIRFSAQEIMEAANDCHILRTA